MARKIPSVDTQLVATGKTARAPATKPAVPRRSPSAARRVRGGSATPPETQEEPDLARRLADLACDPIAIMARIAADEAADIKLRFAAAKELAAYLMVKPRTRGDAPAPALDVGAIIARSWRQERAADEGA